MILFICFVLELALATRGRMGIRVGGGLECVGGPMSSCCLFLFVCLFVLPEHERQDSFICLFLE